MDLREIDRLVAEHVMGWIPSEAAFEIWHPTTKIADAWEVLEELKHWHPCLAYCDTTMAWSVDWTKPRRDDVDPLIIGDPDWDAPLVICLAALKAKGIEVPK